MHPAFIPTNQLVPRRASLPWYRIWFGALIRPTVDNYHYLLRDPKANLGRAVLWIVMAGLAGGLLSYGIAHASNQFEAYKGINPLTLDLDYSVPLFGFVVFVVFLLIEHVVARVAGGKASFSSLAFMSAAYTAPLIVLSGLLNGIARIWTDQTPIVVETPIEYILLNDRLPYAPEGFLVRHALLSLVLFGYSLVALRAVHDLRLSRAFLALLIPTALGAGATYGVSTYALNLWVCGACSVVVSSDAADDEPPSAIYVMDVDGSNVRQLTDPAGDDGYPAWSPDGKMIAFTSRRDGNEEIYVMKADGTGQTRLTEDDATDWSPAWSPDGKDIAFSSDRSGDNLDVYVMASDGSHVTQLTTDPGNDDDPVWSPDGKWIAFDSSRDEDWNIYIMKADGGLPTRLLNWPADELFPTWSPDGKSLAFASWDEYTAGIYVKSVDGAAVVDLSGPGNNLWPEWSPDGERIVFESDRDSEDGEQNIEVYVMSQTGGLQQRLTKIPGYDGAPAWSPDGKKIVFSSRRDGTPHRQGPQALLYPLYAGDLEMFPVYSLLDSLLLH